MPQGYRNGMYRRGYRQYNPSYQAAGFNPAIFEGTSVDFKPHDFSVYERGLANLEARMTTAAEKQGAVDEVLAKIELQLNPAEREWFAGYKQDIKNQIQSDVDAGNFGSAIRKATTLAGQVVNDSRVSGRIEANAKYQEEIKRQKDRVAKGEVSQDAFDWWLKQNEYNYEDKFDAAGNVVSGYEQQFTNLYKKLDVPGLAMAGFKLVTAKKGSTSTDGSTTVHNNTTGELVRGNNTYKAGEGVSSSGHSSSSYERVSFDDIRNNIEELIALTDEGFEQVEQAYNIAMDKFKDLEKQYNEAFETDPTSEKTKLLGQQLEVRKNLLFKNGSETDFKDYFARVITDNLFAQNLAYDWKTTASGGTSTYSITTPTSTSSTNGASATPKPGYNYNYNTGMWEPPVVIMEDESAKLINEIDETSKQASDRFK